MTLGLVATLVSGLLIAGVGRRLTQLRDDNTRNSPWFPMWRVAGVTVLAAAGGLATTLRLLLS